LVGFGLTIGGGCQAGINSLSAPTYPSAIRATGAGWALGAGRIGSIAGPLLGGLLLGFGFRPQKIFCYGINPGIQCGAADGNSGASATQFEVLHRRIAASDGW